MFYTTSAFKTNIKDGVSPQDFMLLGIEKGEPVRGFFSALDGDFTYNGVTLEQDVCQSEDLKFGGTPAGALSFELMNTNKVLSDFPWGKMVAYMGVKVDEATISPNSSTYSFVSFNSTTYTGRSDGVYNGSTKIYSSSVPITGLIGDGIGGRLIALGKGVCVVFDISDDSYTSFTPHRLMAKKMMNGLSIVFTSYTVAASGSVLRTRRYNVEKKTSETYEYVNLGMYMIERPDSLQNAVITVNDANNVLSLLDVDATSFLDNITYPVTVGAFTAALLNGLNIDVVAPSSGWSTSIASNPFGNASYTKRDLLGFVAEFLGCVIAFDGCYKPSSSYVLSPCVLKFVPPCGSTSQETVAWGNIKEQTLAVKDYTTPLISKVQLKTSDGSTVESSISRDASDNGIYQISGNPLLNSIPSQVTTAAALGKFAFNPTTCDVIAADPSIEMGDIVTVKTAENDTEVEYDVYGRPTGQTVTNNPAVIPLMSRTLHWQGTCAATYQATGQKARKVDKTAPVYTSATANRYSEIFTEDAVLNFSNSLDPEDVFNRLTNNGAIQGIFRDSNTGDLYINGEFIQANTIRAGSIETLDGTSWLTLLNGFFALGTSNNVFVQLGDWKVYTKEDSSNPAANKIQFSPMNNTGVSFNIYPNGGLLLQNGHHALITFTGATDYALTIENGIETY